MVEVFGQEAVGLRPRRQPVEVIEHAVGGQHNDPLAAGAQPSERRPVNLEWLASKIARRIRNLGANCARIVGRSEVECGPVEDRDAVFDDRPGDVQRNRDVDALRAQPSRGVEGGLRQSVKVGGDEQAGEVCLVRHGRPRLSSRVRLFGSSRAQSSQDATAPESKSSISAVTVRWQTQKQTARRP